MLIAGKQNKPLRMFDQFWICPYCGWDTKGRMCCGEVHSEQQWHEINARGQIISDEPFTEEQVNEIYAPFEAVV